MKRRITHRHKQRAMIIIIAAIFFGSMIGGALLSSRDDVQGQQVPTLPDSNYIERMLTPEERYLILTNGMAFAEILGPEDCEKCDEFTFGMRKKMGEYGNRIYVSRVVDDSYTMELVGRIRQETVKITDDSSFNETLVDDFVCGTLVGNRPEKCALRKLR